MYKMFSFFYAIYYIFSTHYSDVPMFYLFILIKFIKKKFLNFSTDAGLKTLFTLNLYFCRYATDFTPFLHYHALLVVRHVSVSSRV